jgi:uncharacterized protein (TIGR02453 family)
MLTPDALNFLYELSQNNNRNWFEQNKKRYETVVKAPFEAVVAGIIREVEAFEGPWGLLPKKCVFRIYRDTRFSKDKQPYKNHVSAGWSGGPSSKLSEQAGWPGYYLQIEAGRVMVAGGAYGPEKEDLHRIRTAISQDPDAFRRVVEAPGFRQYYPDGLIGERNKILPPEFKAAAATEDRIFQKQFYFMAETESEVALQPDFVQWVGAHFRAAHEANQYLRRALGLS